MKLTDLVKTTDVTLEIDKWDKELIVDVQTALAAMGLYPNNIIDGIMGPKTKEGFRKFKEITHQSHPNLLGGGSAKLLLQEAAKADLSLEYAIEIIKDFEGLSLSVYPDPRTKGKPYTVGYGSTKKEDGTEWKMGESITSERAEHLLQLEIEERLLPKLETIPVWDSLNNYQKAALISFAYNLGPNFYGAQGFDTITRVLKEKRFKEVPDAFMLYINKGSSVEKGLRRRRKAEGDLWKQQEHQQSLKTAHNLNLADRIYNCCKRRNYTLEMEEGAINLIGVEGLNIDGSTNNDAPDGWNDIICALTFKQGKPTLLGIYQATTEPGAYYTKQPLNSGGCARLQLGQHPGLWAVGVHKGYEAMQQVGKAILVRDKNKNHSRDDSVTVEVNNGINLHRTLAAGWQSLSGIGKFSAGCAVVKSYTGFLELMKHIKRSKQYRASKNARFTFTLLWKEWL
jgi:lysozyme